MPKDYSHQNLKGLSFRDRDLSYASFAESDLRGADFSGSNLTGADLTSIKTGIAPIITIVIFFVALIISAISGYMAMLAGNTLQEMIQSTDIYVKDAGYVTIALIVLFLAYAYWKGGGNAIRNIVLPAVVIALCIGIVVKVAGIGTGRAMVYLILALALTVVMFIVGTIARSAAGALSNILFIAVALVGGLFGKSVGGGIGTAIMAISCALISKKALSGGGGFDTLRKIACWITSRFGTSFRNSKLGQANFSKSVIHNSDFSNADISAVQWGNSSRQNCIVNEKWIKNDG